MAKWIKINKVLTKSTTACTCNSTCNSDACDECDATCYGDTCTCESACYEETCTSCYVACYPDVCSTCDFTCNTHSCTQCNTSCYSATKYGCTCNYTCYSQACSVCNATCNANTCTCESTCYSETCTSCNSTCYEESCTCDSACNVDLCDQCDSACYEYAYDCDVVKEINQSTISVIESFDQTPPVCGSMVIPTGLIIGLNHNNIGWPTGWSPYATANDNYIVGAGSTYAVNANAAGTGSTIISTTSTTGDHIGAGTIDNVATSGGQWRNNTTSGDHSHTFTTTYTPPSRFGRLIKADAGNTEIPIDGVVFGIGDDKSAVATSVWTSGLFCAKIANSTSGSEDYAGEVSTNSGTHGHGNTDSGEGSGTTASSSYGGHTHTIDLQIRHAIQQVYLCAWSNAAAAVSLSTYGKNIIGMYESTTPPDGWYLCNGSNGTPDLRDHFVQCSTVDLAGLTFGASTSNLSIRTLTTLVHGVHRHRNTNDDGFSGGTGYHDEYMQMASHEKLYNVQTYLPPYYALAFIMFGG